MRLADSVSLGLLGGSAPWATNCNIYAAHVPLLARRREACQGRRSLHHPAKGVHVQAPIVASRLRHFPDGTVILVLIPMSTSNATIADHLRRYAAALSLEGANRFKLKAYRRAAETIEALDDNVAELLERGQDLTELPGIGKAINDVVGEIVRTGTLNRLNRTLAALPAELVEIAGKPALDPKKVSRVYKKLGINSLFELKKNLESGKIGEQFGARIEYHIRQGLDERPRSLLYAVEGIAATIERRLRSLPGLTHVSAAG